MANAKHSMWKGKPRTLPIQKFIERTERNADGCLIWTSTIEGSGYGSFKVTSMGISRAYRFAYEYFRGPVPEGMDLDHLCRNRACCDPYHLEVVTRGENLRRGAAPNMVTHRTGICAKGHSLLDDGYRGSGGRRRCRICHNEAAKNWRKQNGLEYHRAWRAKRREAGNAVSTNRAAIL